MSGDISEMALCTTCLRLTGFCDSNAIGPRPALGRREHRCQCQPHDDAWKESWVIPGFRLDILAHIDMCKLCMRGLVNSGTRWSWLACETCRRVNNRMGNTLAGFEHPGNKVLALGRHTIMNSGPVPLRGRSAGQMAVDEIVTELLAAMGPPGGFWLNWADWSRDEGRRLVESGGFTERPSVPLEEWFETHPGSEGASVDALCRFADEDRWLNLPPLADLARARHEFRESLRE
ncbi:MAG TPA: hypothetical protein ENI86_01655 [Acidimicrobiales bacterium]|nr:hypothetical protein [Acidimicrobiales bacterium]